MSKDSQEEQIVEGRLEEINKQLEPVFTVLRDLVKNEDERAQVENLLCLAYTQGALDTQNDVLAKFEHILVDDPHRELTKENMQPIEEAQQQDEEANYD